MHLSKVSIKNFRSLKEINLNFHKGKNIIVGRNNAGKSNIIKALDIVLGESSPTYQKSENVTPLDFYTHKVHEHSGKVIEQTEPELWIIAELTREENEDLNFLEINKCYGYYKYQNPITDDQFRNNLQEIFEINPDTLNYGEKVYVNAKLRNQVSFETELNTMFQFAYAFRAVLDQSNDVIHKDIRFFYRLNAASDWTMAFKDSIRNELLQTAIIPSFRDPQNQLRSTPWTWYGKLMKYLTTSHAKIADLKKELEKVRIVANKIFQDAQDKVQQGSLDIAFPGSKIEFQFNEELKTDIYKDAKVFIDDGIKAPLAQKGSGIQSATVIGLFNYYTKHINTKTSALLCVEEPELYLHPHARRVVSDRLDEFVDGRNQVIITTHSAEFIRTIDENLNVILVRRGDEGTETSSVNIKENRHLLLDNNHNEVFFADKVIICEDLDHYILRWIARERFPKHLDEKNVSIVGVGSKDNIDTFVKLIIALGIKCYIFADFDYFLRDQKEEADKYSESIKDTSGRVTTFSKRHKSVGHLPIAFFSQQCIFSNQATAEIEKIKTIRQNIKTNTEKLFYTAKTLKEFDSEDEIEDCITNLRKHGIGILSGEIENLSKDEAIIAPATIKLSNKKIFQVNQLINDGKKASEIFETKEVEEFLDHVLNKS